MEPVFFVWLALAVIFIIFEIFAPGFIFACFVVGAAAAGITSLVVDSYVLQGAVFAVVSLVLIPLTRPLAARITKPSPVASNMDALIGKTGQVKKEVSPQGGQVVVDDQVWQARAETTIPIDHMVTIVASEGTKLKVKEQ